MPDWFAEATLRDDVEVDISFQLAETFYYGPANSFTKEQWTSMRAPLVQPAVRRDGRLVRSADLVGHEDQLVAHYLDVLAQARAHGESPANFYFWLSLQFHVSDGVALTFPYCDGYGEQRPILLAVAGDTTGSLVSDQDQGWALEMCATADRIYAREEDPDEGVVRSTVAFSRDLLRTQIAALLPRVEALIARATAATRRDYWT